mmetsp:Transcript_60066/g.186370  ORF Transcript_60066/g.186370 Transcript_60066/m.186370 type:complete len:111 (-) Transcript_60066:250-582(-)
MWLRDAAKQLHQSLDGAASSGSGSGTKRRVRLTTRKEQLLDVGKAKLVADEELVLISREHGAKACQCVQGRLMLTRRVVRLVAGAEEREQDLNLGKEGVQRKPQHLQRLS